MSNTLMFSTRVKELRSNRNLTQKEFAEKVGVSAATLSAYETSIKNPSLDIVYKIATVFEVSVDWLCGIDHKKVSAPETYADVIKLLCLIDSAINLEVIRTKYVIDPEMDPEDYEYRCDIGVASFYIDDASCYAYERSFFKMQEFLREWKKIKELYENGAFDNDLYQLWVEKQMSKYNMKIQEGDDNGNSNQKG